MKGSEDEYSIDDIFIHFLDHQLLQNHNIKLNSEKSPAFCEFRLAIRLSLLLAKNSIIIPVSNYFENTYSKKLLSEYSNFGEFGYIQFVSGALNFSEFLHDKQIQYKNTPKTYPFYFKEGGLFLPSNGKWLIRQNSSTKDIKKEWKNNLDNSKIWENIYKFTNYPNVSEFEKDISEVPLKIEHQAFIPDFAINFIKSQNEKQLKGRLNVIITNSYIQSFAEEFDAYCLKDLISFDTNIYLQNVTKKISFLFWKRHLASMQLLELVQNCTPNELLTFKHSDSWKQILSYQKFPLLGSNSIEVVPKIITPKTVIPIPKPVNQTNLFENMNDNKRKIDTSIPQQYIDNMRTKFSELFMKKELQIDNLQDYGANETFRQRYTDKVDNVDKDIQLMKDRFINQINGDFSSISKDEATSIVENLIAEFTKKLDNIDNKIDQLAFNTQALIESLNSLSENEEKQADELLQAILKQSGDKISTEKKLEMDEQLMVSAKLKIAIPILPFTNYEMEFWGADKKPINSWKDLYQIFVKKTK